MLKKNENTAILIFTRTSHEEAAVKKFLNKKDNHSNEIIARNLIANTIRKARKTQQDVHVHFSSSQKGKSFGEKLTNAIALTFDKGYENIVVIGNDCPQLTTENLNNSIQKVQQGNFVIGADNDDGAYLIGLNRKQFNRDNFSNLDWCTSSLNESLVAYANLFPIFCLEKYVDVDSYSDLLLLSSEKSLQINKILNGLSFAIQKVFFTQNFNVLPRFFSNSLLLRGPPVAC